MQTCIGKAFWRNGHCYVFESWSVETIVTARIPTPEGIKFVIDEHRLRCGITIGVWDKMPEGAYQTSDPFYEFLSKDDGYVPIQLQEGYDDDYRK